MHLRKMNQIKPKYKCLDNV